MIITENPDGSLYLEGEELDELAQNRVIGDLVSQGHLKVAVVLEPTAQTTEDDAVILNQSLRGL